MVSGNQWAPPACCGAPHIVCSYLITGTVLHAVAHRAIQRARYGGVALPDR